MTDITIMVGGQSNALGMAQLAVPGVNPQAGVLQWDQFSRSWLPPVGAGVIELGNNIRASGGYANVYIYVCASGGASLVPLATNPVQPHNCWMIQALDGPLQIALSQVQSAGQKPQFVIWMQAEQDSLLGRSNSTYDILGDHSRCLSLLRDFLLRAWGTTADQCVWLIAPVGKVAGGYTRFVLQAQMAFVAQTPFTQMAPAKYHLALSDDTHMTADSCRTYGALLAQQMLNILGKPGFQNCVPHYVVSATKSGTTVAVFTSSNTGVVADQGTSFLTGWVVWDYLYTRTIKIREAFVTSGFVHLTLAEPLIGQTVHVGYMIDNDADASCPVYDQQGVLIAKGNALLPCPQVVDAVDH